MLTIPLDYARFLLSAIHTVFTSRWPQNWRRLIFLVLLGIVQPFLVSTSLLCLVLDHVLYPGFRKQPIREPIFIVGNWRTGSTYLQRLLVRDRQGIATFRTVDMFLPSIIQKRAAQWLGRADRSLGGYGHRIVEALDHRFLADYSRIHDTAFLKAEEDEFLFLYAMKSAALYELFPKVASFRRFLYFDEQVSDYEKRFSISVYRSLMARHLYHCGGTQRFLSKNPVFTAKIKTLADAFPDARFINLVRSPLETLPSTASLMHFVWWETGALPPGELNTPWVTEVARYFYDHPRRCFAEMPMERWTFLRYEDLLRDPEGSVRRLWDRFDLPLDLGLERVLRDESRNRRPFRSSHHYSGDQFGFHREDILRDFADVCAEYGFEVEPSQATAK